MKKKNVLILTQTLSEGGAEKLAANLSLGLAESANVILVTYKRLENEYLYSGTRIDLDAVGTNPLSRILCMVKRIHKVRKIKRQYDVDFAVSYVPSADYVNIFSRHNKTEKIIIDVVSNMTLAFPGGLSRVFRKYVIKKADYVVTVSEGVRADLIENFGVNTEKSQTIYNSCDIRTIGKICEEDREYEEIKSSLPEKFIASMGSFRHPKGHWHLIKAFYFIKDVLPNISLVILGDGIYRNQYIELIEKLDLKERVFLPGFINPPHSVIAHADAFVFSSLFEGFGNALIEAMVCNVPIVSADCLYGPREVLAPDTPVKTTAKNIEKCAYGYLTPPFGNDSIDTSTTITKEEKIMGQAIVQLLNDKEQCRKYAIDCAIYCKKFDNGTITNQWVELINRIEK